jgi:hypothetical protein
MLSTLHHHQGEAAPNWPTHKILSLSHKIQALLAAADHELAESYVYHGKNSVLGN